MTFVTEYDIFGPILWNFSKFFGVGLSNVLNRISIYHWVGLRDFEMDPAFKFFLFILLKKIFSY